METKFIVLVVIGSILFGIGLAGAIAYFSWTHTIKIIIGHNLTITQCDTTVIQCSKCSYETGKTYEYYIDCLRKISSFDSGIVFSNYYVLITCAFPGTAILFVSILMVACKR